MVGAGFLVVRGGEDVVDGEGEDVFFLGFGDVVDWLVWGWHC